MKKQFFALAIAALAAGGALAQATDTIAKVKASGAVTFPIRRRSTVMTSTFGKVYTPGVAAR